MAVAFEWVGRVLAVALTMVLPGIGGSWLDRRWGTNYLALLGFAIGLAAGLMELMVMGGVIKRGGRPKK
jgi:hypothetical protein